MKKCTQCKIQFSDLWYKCIKCYSELKNEQSKPIFGKKEVTLDVKKPSQFIEQLIEHANALVIFISPDSEMLMCNEAIEFFTGYKREELIAHGWLDLLYKGQEVRKEMFKAVIKGCLISIRSKTYEGTIIRKDGSQCMLSWRLAAIKDERKNVLGLLCIAQDVTDKKINEGEMDIHGQRFKDILSSIREYVLMTTNLEGKITYYGLGARDVFGWAADEVYLEDISLIYPKNTKTELIKSISEAIKRDSKFEGEIYLTRKGDIEFPAVLTITPLLNRESQTTGYTYMAQDITQKKKMEQQMIQSEKMIAVGQLASGVAHEMNNPLLVILGRLALIEKNNLSADTVKVLDIIKTQAERMRIIVDRLLSYSRNRQPDMKPVDINELLKSIGPLLSYYPEFKKIKWEEKLQQDVPAIKGDFNQLQEVFVNLGLNACQAMPEGGSLTIISSYKQKEKFVEVFVKDTGLGMNDEQLKNLFSPFYTTKKRGTGLGLAICRNMIELHKGKVDVDSHPGKGSTFVVKLPVAI